MKKSLRNRVIVLILVFALLLDILCITMNYRNFVQANEQFSYSTAIGLFNTVVNVIMLLLANAICKKVSGTGIW